MYDGFTCDIKDCKLLPTKTLSFRGLGLFSRFSEDSMDLCAKHYLELLNYVWGLSKTKELSEK
jgi:hypothetical protein